MALSGYFCTICAVGAESPRRLGRDVSVPRQMLKFQRTDTMQLFGSRRVVVYGFACVFFGVAPVTKTNVMVLIVKM